MVVEVEAAAAPAEGPSRDGDPSSRRPSPALRLGWTPCWPRRTSPRARGRVSRPCNHPDPALQVRPPKSQPPRPSPLRLPISAVGRIFANKANFSGLPAAVPPARSETPTRNKTNDRLQERLARAVAAKKQAGLKSEAASTIVTPTASPRQSIDVPGRSSTDSATAQAQSPASPQTTASPRASRDLGRKSTDSRAGTEKSTDTGAVADAPSAVEATAASGEASVEKEKEKEEAKGEGESEPAGVGAPAAGAVVELQEDRIKQLEKALEDLAAQQQEETHNHVEQIDALQAKLQYLSRETTDAARKAAKEAPAGSMEKKLADKDAQIAGLMEEGKNLASTEQKLRAVIKSLRSKIGENDKEISSVKTAKGKIEQELDAARRKSRRVQELEKYQEELHKRIGQSQKEIDSLKSEASGKDRTIADLKTQLQKAADQAEALNAKVNEEALAKERRRVRELEDEVSDLKVEKDLVADRGRARESEVQEKAERAAERARAVEVELKAEIQVMESKLESMRVMAEEVSSGAMGDSQAKLLRQVETLQTQYAIATENWQGIESTLLARIANLEKERDEAQHRESEMRRKAREAVSIFRYRHAYGYANKNHPQALRARRQEEELEDAKTQIPTIQEDVKAHQSQIESLTKRAEEAEAALAEAKAELEKQKTAAAEATANATREQQDRQGPWIDQAPSSYYRPGSRPESPSASMPSRSFSTELLGLGTLSGKFRKHSAPSSNGDPVERYVSRRPSVQPPSSRPSIYTERSSTLPPILSPTIEALSTAPSVHPLERNDPFDNGGGDTMPMSSSPKQMAQDMVSVSTVAAGPSVQLVEKLSAAVRRLEGEKVAAREELARISAQRDEARAEMVALMREVERGRVAGEEVARLRGEVAEVNERYETTLELLGEKSEMVEELRADVQDVKAMYRDLVERTIK